MNWTELAILVQSIHTRLPWQCERAFMLCSGTIVSFRISTRTITRQQQFANGPTLYRTGGHTQSAIRLMSLVDIADNLTLCLSVSPFPSPSLYLSVLLSLLLSVYWCALRKGNRTFKDTSFAISAGMDAGRWEVTHMLTSQCCMCKPTSAHESVQYMTCTLHDLVTLTCDLRTSIPRISVLVTWACTVIFYLSRISCSRDMDKNWQK